MTPGCGEPSARTPAGGGTEAAEDDDDDSVGEDHGGADDTGDGNGGDRDDDDDDDDDDDEPPPDDDDDDDDDDEPPDPFAPSPTGCITSLTPGVTDHTCDGLTVTVSAPASCLEAPCGVILDIHGASMSAQQQDNNTNLRALGAQYGYIVVQPTTDGFSWSAGHETRIMTGLFDVLDAFDADLDRVHVTGFSAGGGATWVILCTWPEVFASAAPAAATGQYLGSAPVCFGSNPPSPELDLLYINGETDPFETMDYVDQLVGKIILDWTLGAPMTIDGDGTFQRLRHENANGTVFDLLTHTYETDEMVALGPIAQGLVGHCYPGSMDHSPTEPGQLAGYGCKGANSFHYGETVIEFFMEHPK